MEQEKVERGPGTLTLEDAGFYICVSANRELFDVCRGGKGLFLLTRKEMRQLADLLEQALGEKL